MENKLGRVLEKLRGLSKMTLREAAKRSGLSHTYIRDIELGKNRKTKVPIKPSPDTIRRLSEAYNYDYEELMKLADYLDNNEDDIIKDQAKNVVIEIYTRLPQDKKKIVDDLIKALAGDQ